MKECKCGKMLPCYRDGYGVSHHLDDTHEKVYELNKQMCDLESGLSNDLLDMQMLIVDKLAKDAVEGARTPDWAKNMLAGLPEQLSRAKYEILDEILKEKNRFMEEKKTKKMTKAEAFEYLKHKKVAVTGDTITLQNKLFNIGYKWCDGSIEAVPMVDFLFIDDETFQFTESLSHFRNCGYTEISADDILSIEIVEACAKDDEDPYFKGRIKDLQEMIEDDEVLIITKTNFLTMTK